jgi:hypothetical protein
VASSGSDSGGGGGAGGIPVATPTPTPTPILTGTNINKTSTLHGLNPYSFPPPTLNPLSACSSDCAEARRSFASAPGSS